MSEKLTQFYLNALTPSIVSSGEHQRFITRLKTGQLAREDNTLSHICALILPYDPNTKKVLVVHHKKAHSWIFPGGHIEQDELPPDAAFREAGEELGLSRDNMKLIGPFGAQVLDINNPPQVCREHYDLFYGVATNPTGVTVNMDEFLEYEWLPIDDARERITMKYYQDALDKFVRFID